MRGPELRSARSRSTGSSARKALPRWEIAFFSSSVYSAERAGAAGRHEDRVVAEPVGARAARAPAEPSTRPSTPSTAPVGHRDDGRADEGRAHGARRARRRPVREAARGWRGLAAPVVRRRRRCCPTSGPRRRPGSHPARRPRGQSRRPRPAGRWPAASATALSRAFAEEGHLRLGDVRGAPSTSSAPTTSSPSSSTSVGEDLAELVDLVLVAGRKDEPAAHRSRSRGVAVERRLLERGELGTAVRGEVEQAAEQVAVERLALGRALDLDEAAVAGHDDVHVGLRGGVLRVVEVEDRAGRRRGRRSPRRSTRSAAARPRR